MAGAQVSTRRAVSGALSSTLSKALAAPVGPRLPCADPLIRHEFRAKPDDLRMITVDGDSMEPLLSSGDRIMIDVSRNLPSPPGIFVIWDGLGLVAKRIEHVPHSDPLRVVLKSLNPQYDSYEPERRAPRFTLPLGMTLDPVLS